MALVENKSFLNTLAPALAKFCFVYFFLGPTGPKRCFLPKSKMKWRILFSGFTSLFPEILDHSCLNIRILKVYITLPLGICGILENIYFFNPNPHNCYVSFDLRFFGVRASIDICLSSQQNTLFYKIYNFKIDRKTSFYITLHTLNLVI